MAFGTRILSVAWATLLASAIGACNSGDFAGTADKASAPKKDDGPGAGTSGNKDKTPKIGVPINETKDIPPTFGTDCKVTDESIVKVSGDKLTGKKIGEITLECKRPGTGGHSGSGGTATAGNTANGGTAGNTANGGTAGSTASGGNTGSGGTSGDTTFIKVIVYDPKDGIPPGLDAGDDTSDGGMGASSGKSTAGASGGTGTPGQASGNGTANATANSSGGSTGNPGGSIEVEDGSMSKTGEDDAIGIDGGGTSQNLYSDMTIQLTRQDDCGEKLKVMQVELWVDHVMVKSAPYNCPKKPGDPVVLPGMCRNKRESCVNLKIKGDLDTFGNQNNCVFVQPQGANTMKVDFDQGGSGLLGSCQPDEDDTLIISCPGSSSLVMEPVCK